MHVAVAHGREVSDLVLPQVTVRVHQTRHPTAHVVPARRAFPRHSLARAAVEMASLAGSEPAHPGESSRRSCSNGCIRAADLSAYGPTSNPTLPKRRLIRETVADVLGGAHSLPELDYARALRRAGLPQPTRQRKVCRRNGVWYLDNDFDDWLVTVEVNGMQHHELLASEADDIRRAGLQIRGRLVVDISSYAVRHREPLVVLRTAEALVSRGWRPAPKAAAVLAEYARLEGWPELAA